MKILCFFICILLISSIVSARIDNIDKLKWDWVSISPSYLEFDKPECKYLQVQPTFRVDNYTQVQMEIFSKTYPNGVSSGYIFKIYSDNLRIHKSEVREVMVCADYESGSVPIGEYDATLMFESVDRVYQIPLTLKIDFRDRFFQKSWFEIKQLWFKELFVIPTPDNTYLSINGYHFIFFWISLMVFVWLIYLFSRRRKK